MKILIVQIARIGDLIMTSTLVSGLLSKYGEGKVSIDFLVSKPFAATADGIPGINKIWTISLTEIIKPISGIPSTLYESYGILRDLCQNLRQEKYDIVLNLTHTDSSAYLTKLIEGKETTGITLEQDGHKTINSGWAKYYYNAFINRKLNQIHIADIHLKMAGVELKQKLCFQVRSEIQREADEIVAKINPDGASLIAIIPGASTPEKMWGTDNFSQALRFIKKEHDITTVVFGSANDKQWAELVLTSVPDAVNMAGKTTIGLLAGILKHCDLVLTNDTGPMHLAAAVGTRTIDISLGSAYANETAPYADGHLVVEPNIDCYPCNPRYICKHQDCHACVSPQLVAKLSVACLKGTGIDDMRIPTAQCRISMTGFDEGGYWKLTPLAKSDARDGALVLDAYRKIWDDSLGKTVSYEPLGVYDLSRLWEYSEYLSSELQIRKNIGKIDSVMELLVIGDKAAEMMACLAELEADIDSIARLSYILGEVDRAIVEKAYQIPNLMPLVTQFTLEKDAMKGENLRALSESSEQLYRVFAARMCSVEIFNDVSSAVSKREKKSEIEA